MRVSLNTQILAGAVLGIVAGAVLGHAGLDPAASGPWLAGFDFLGRVFISLLKLIVVPLVFISISAGIGNLKNTSGAKKIWPVLVLYSITTTALAAACGLTLMNLVKPGVGLDIHLFKEYLKPAQIQSLSFGDFGRRLFDAVFTDPLQAIQQNNIITIVFFAVALGVLIIVFGGKSEGVLKLINKLFEWLMKIIRWIMYLAPLGVMGLLAKLVAQANLPLLSVLAKYILVVVAATVFHGLITLPAILWLITKTSPVQFFQAMKEALVTAFSTSSSTATLPVSLRCITENLKVDGTIARFVLPVGSVLNMDGTAMYESMAALFVANLCGAHLNLTAQIAVMFTAMMASIGAPGIPSAGMVTMILVLQSVGLPAQAVAILIAIDRPLDTIRTVVNVEGDCIGACVVDHMVK